MNVVTWVEFPFLVRPSLWRLDEGPRCQTAGQRSPALSVWVPWGQVPWRQVSHQAGLTSGMLVTEHRSLSVFFRTGGCRSLPGYTTEAVDPWRQPCLPPWLHECPDPWSLLHGPLEPCAMCPHHMWSSPATLTPAAGE